MAVELDGANQKVIIDADSDTYLQASTDDTLDIYIAGAKDFTFTANTLTAQSGSTIASQALTATTIGATGVVSISDGTAGAPALTNTGDTNCGLFFSAADTLAFSAAGTSQFTMADGLIAPVTDNDVDLGTSSLEFKDGYFDGTLYCDTLNLAGTDHTAISGAITVAGNWRLSADQTSLSTDAIITNNWEEVDTSPYSRIGTVMSESSGVFTFPSTGIYYIIFTCLVSDQAEITHAGAAIEGTTNNSSYVDLAHAYQMLTNQHDANPYECVSAHLLFDCTDTANNKVRFSVESQSGSLDVKGDSAISETNAVFIRLGDT